MSNITELIPNKDFIYKHLHRTDEGYVMTEPFNEVISRVYEGLKVIITRFGSSGLYFGDEFKEGKLIYDYQLVKYCKNGNYPDDNMVTLELEDQEFLHSLVYSYIIDINKRELFKDARQPTSYYNS
jgi:hypothetical protein